MQLCLLSQAVLSVVNAHLSLPEDLEWTFTDEASRAAYVGAPYPRQNNGIDCGVFALRIIQQLMMQPLVRPSTTPVRVALQIIIQRLLLRTLALPLALCNCNAGLFDCNLLY